MPWASAPIHSDLYSVRTADALKSLDPVEYSPGELLSIYVRTFNHDQKYRGLLVHAVAGNGSTVGSWEFPTGENNPVFHSPHAGAVLQVSAELKPARSVLHWRAPSQGTGSVTFKAVIKTGPANTGAFFYPNSLGDLILTERTSEVPPLHLTIGLAGKSCDQVCANHACDDNPWANNQRAFENELDRVIACQRPLLSNCMVPGFTINQKHCYFADFSCGNNTLTPKCSSLPAPDEILVCPCKTSPSKPPSYTLVSQAPTTHAQMIWAIPFLLTASRWISPLQVLGIVLSSAVHVRAHNWVHTPGRGQGLAAVTRPCLKRKSTDLHAQVNFFP